MKASESSAEIESELLAEVQQEMSRRGTTVKIKRDPSDDLPAAMCASAILATLAILAGTGVMMALTYAATADDAHASVWWLQSTEIGSFSRAMHMHGANLGVLLSGAYLGYLVWRGLYRKPHHWRWWRAGLLVALLIVADFTGRFLTYDQNALHGTLIRVSYIESVPLLGPVLVQLLTGGGEMGTGALTRFFGLHVLVAPAMLAITLRWFWRDTRSARLYAAQLAVPAAVVLVLAAAALISQTAPGLNGTLSEPFADARPEWYGLPLYELLKILPDGVLQLGALVLPPLAGFAVIAALPFIEKASKNPPKLLKPFRVAMLATIVLGIGLALLPILEDRSEGAGWFRKYEVGDLMLGMGARNEALGNSAEPAPADTHNLARDLILLHERLKGVYPEKLEGDAARWDEWAAEGARLARELLLAADETQQRAARKKLREVCAKCHDAQEKEKIVVDPPPRFVTRMAKEPEPATYFFDQQQLAALKPTPLRSTGTKRVMDQGKFRLRDVLAHAGVVKAETDRTKEQALVDLRQVANTIGTLHEANAAAFVEEGAADWDRWAKDLLKAVDELGQARDATDVARKAAAAGKVCETCHDAADEPDEPIEWRYQSLLQ